MLTAILSATAFAVCECLDLGFWVTLAGVLVLPWGWVALSKQLKIYHFDSSLDTGESRRSVPLPKQVVKNCTHAEQYIVAPSGKLLYVQTFIPDSPRAVVVYLHGYGDHTGFFKERIFERIVGNGYALLALDHAGFGRSDGLHGYVPSFDSLVADSAKVIQIAKTNQLQTNLPKLKYFAWGESMGGGVCLRLALDHPGSVDGVLLFAPMCRISDAVKPPDILVNFLFRLKDLWPTLPITPVPSLVDKCFQDPEILKAAKQNPLGYRKLPRLGTAAEMLRATLDIQSRMAKITIPFFVAHGKDDLVTDPQCSVELYNRSSTNTKDKKLAIYEHCWHGLGHEPEEYVAQMWREVFDWLESQL